MLVKDCMTLHPAMIAPEARAAEAQRIMSETRIRHLPVVGDGKRLLGLITREQLRLKPDLLGSLNVWEITRYLADVTVADVMLKAAEVNVTAPDRTVERAARDMADSWLGCLPVVDGDGVVVGLLSEAELLSAFQEMLGLPAEGVRVTIRMPNREGEFGKLMQFLGKQWWGVMGIGTFPSPRREGYYDVVLKIPDVSLAEVWTVLGRVEDQEIVDIREVI